MYYTPYGDYCGSDSFTYTIDDGNGGSDTATVYVTVSCGNDPPVANDDSASTNENTPVTIDVLVNDYDPDGTINPTTVLIISGTSDGSTSINPSTGAVTYTPDPDFCGTDGFTYTVNDDEGATSNLATVTITVRCCPPEVWIDDDWNSQSDVDTYNPALTWQYDTFNVIQDGVDIVCVGGIVHVLEGIYLENVYIWKELTLQAEPLPAIDAIPVICNIITSYVII